VIGVCPITTQRQPATAAAGQSVGQVSQPPAHTKVRAVAARGQRPARAPGAARPAEPSARERQLDRAGAHDASRLENKSPSGGGQSVQEEEPVTSQSR